jgi:hypothetical protein
MEECEIQQGRCLAVEATEPACREVVIASTSPTAVAGEPKAAETPAAEAEPAKNAAEPAKKEPPAKPAGKK